MVRGHRKTLFKRSNAKRVHHTLNTHNDESIKKFLELDKNTFDCIKPFITFSLMLNAGGIAALLVYNNKFFPVISYLLAGEIISMVMYLFSIVILSISVIWHENFLIIYRSRIGLYICVSLGFLSSVLSFYFAAFEGVRVLSTQVPQ